MTVDKFIPWLERVRAAVGDGFDLALELRPWSLEEALQLAPVLEELRFTWFEEPMSRQGEDAFDRYLELQEALPTVMISGGESCWNSHELKEWVDRGAIEMPQPDAGRIGLMEAWRVVRMAASHGRPFCPHNWGDGSCTLANAALVAASPNALMLEQFETWDPLRTEIFTRSAGGGGRLHGPAGPARGSAWSWPPISRSGFPTSRGGTAPARIR